MGVCGSTEPRAVSVVKPPRSSMPTPTQQESITLWSAQAPAPESTFALSDTVRPTSPITLTLPGCGEHGDDVVITYPRVSAEMVRDLSVRQPYPPVDRRHHPEFKPLVRSTVRRSLSLYGSLMYARGPPPIPVYGPTCQLGQGYYRLIYDDEDEDEQKPQAKAQAKAPSQQPTAATVAVAPLTAQAQPVLTHSAPARPPSQSPALTKQDEAAVLQNQMAIFRSQLSDSRKKTPPSRGRESGVDSFRPFNLSDTQHDDADEQSHTPRKDTHTHRWQSCPRMDFLDELQLPLPGGHRSTAQLPPVRASVSSPLLSLSLSHHLEHLQEQEQHDREYAHAHRQQEETEDEHDAVHAKYKYRADDIPQALEAHTDFLPSDENDIDTRALTASYSQAQAPLPLVHSVREVNVSLDLALYPHDVIAAGIITDADAEATEQTRTHAYTQQTNARTVLLPGMLHQ